MSKGSGGEKASGPQPPSLAWARERTASERPWRSGGGLRLAAAWASREIEASVTVSHGALVQPGVGAIDRGSKTLEVGGGEALASEKSRERASVGCGCARCVVSLERPGTVGGLVGGELGGGCNQGFAVVYVSRRDRGSKSGGERDSRKTLVAEGALAAVVFPFSRFLKPGDGVDEGTRRDVVTGFRGEEQCAGGVAVVVAGEAVVLPSTNGALRG